jgi:phenylacetate-CoA ligase
MPLIRYRTGDLSRFIPGPCSCGSVLRRLEQVRGRLGQSIKLRNGRLLSLADLDDILFSVEAVMDFRAAARQEGDACLLGLRLRAAPGCAENLCVRVHEALWRSETLGSSFRDGAIRLESAVSCSDSWLTDGTAKRTFSATDFSADLP